MHAAIGIWKQWFTIYVNFLVKRVSTESLFSEGNIRFFWYGGTIIRIHHIWGCFRNSKLRFFTSLEMDKLSHSDHMPVLTTRSFPFLSGFFTKERRSTDLKFSQFLSHQSIPLSLICCEASRGIICPIEVKNGFSKTGLTSFLMMEVTPP